jgi:hypothetical protein
VVVVCTFLALQLGQARQAWVFCRSGCANVWGIQKNLFTHCKVWCQCPTLVRVPCHVLLQLCKGHLCFIECQFHSFWKFIDGLDLWRSLVWFETHLRVPTHIEEEGRVLCWSVDVVCVREFAKG